MGYALRQDNYLTPEEYLDGEQFAIEKSEYVRGEVYAMAGASDRHVKVTLNAALLIKQQLRGSGCSTYIADMKVRIEADDTFFYPDVMVTCEPSDQLAERDYAKHHPKLIVEVLSPSTEDKDRGSKFISYRKLDSLEEYLLIDPRKYYVELFRRQNEDEWVLMTRSGAEASLTLNSIGLTCCLADFYDDVRFD
jgi:Uncharacterized protein conserved in cyanobacteria